MSISSLPGGLDDSAAANPLASLSDKQLAAEAAQIQAEIARREEEAKRPKFPLIWDDFQVGSSKDSRDQDAIELNLPEACSNSFRYAGLNIFFRVSIEENGTTIATHIRDRETGDYIALPRPMKLN